MHLRPMSTVYLHQVMLESLLVLVFFWIWVLFTKYVSDLAHKEKKEKKKCHPVTLCTMLSLKLIFYVLTVLLFHLFFLFRNSCIPCCQCTGPIVFHINAFSHRDSDG